MPPQAGDQAQVGVTASQKGKDTAPRSSNLRRLGGEGLAHNVNDASGRQLTVFPVHLHPLPSVFAQNALVFGAFNARRQVQEPRAPLPLDRGVGGVHAHGLHDVARARGRDGALLRLPHTSSYAHIYACMCHGGFARAYGHTRTCRGGHVRADPQLYVICACSRRTNTRRRTATAKHVRACVCVPA